MSNHKAASKIFEIIHFSNASRENSIDLETSKEKANQTLRPSSELTERSSGST